MTGNTYVTDATQGNAVQSIGYGFVFPQGLCTVSGNSFGEHSVTIQMQYKLTSAPAWTTAASVAGPLAAKPSAASMAPPSAPGTEAVPRVAKVGSGLGAGRFGAAFRGVLDMRLLQRGIALGERYSVLLNAVKSKLQFH
jgi:hypothetical protein